MTMGGKKSDKKKDGKKSPDGFCIVESRIQPTYANFMFNARLQDDVELMTESSRPSSDSSNEKDDGNGSKDDTAADVNADAPEDGTSVGNKNETMPSNGRELRRARVEIDSLNSRIDDLMNEMDSLRKEIDDRKKETSDTKEKLKRITDERDDLLLQLKNAIPESKVEELTNKIIDLERENKGLNNRIRELERPEDKIEKSVEVIVPDIQYDIPKETVERADGCVFSSKSFSDGNYLVKLARNGKWVSFRKDVTGAAVCIDGKIRIPALPRYIPFSGPVSYDIRYVEDTMFIDL